MAPILVSVANSILRFVWQMMCVALTKFERHLRWSDYRSVHAANSSRAIEFFHRPPTPSTFPTINHASRLSLPPRRRHGLLKLFLFKFLNIVVLYAAQYFVYSGGSVQETCPLSDTGSQFLVNYVIDIGVCGGRGRWVSEARLLTNQRVCRCKI